jgi:hypothetical protein
MTISEINPAVDAKLRQLGIPFYSINVFGAINCNIHVECQSRSTAVKWVNALSMFAKVKATTHTLVYAKDQKSRKTNGPKMLPMYRIWAVIGSAS